MKHFTKAIFSALFLMLFLPSCATIVGKSEYPVNISSSPEGAKFTVTNSYGVKLHTGQTPSVVTLPSSNGFFRKADYRITYEKSGYDSATINLRSSVNGWYYGNILFGLAGVGLGMLIVDPMSGAMYELPSYASTSLSSNGSEMSAEIDGSFSSGSIDGRIKNVCDTEFAILKKELKSLDHDAFLHKCKIEKKLNIVKMGL